MMQKMATFKQVVVVIIGFAIVATQAGLLKAIEQANPIFDKRAWCYTDPYGYQVTCGSAYKCCTGKIWSACILSNMVCCNFGSSVGGCPVRSTCGYDYYRNPACIRDGTTTIFSIETTTTTRPVSSPTTSSTFTTTSSTISSTTVTSSSTSSSKSDTSAPSAAPVVVSHNPQTSSSGLSKGAIIGIVVPATCSVIGLIISLWIKWHLGHTALRKG
ncbi:hypothetical protein B0J14DRAFT_131520 [Halenospora varia]|nr:hypothetical protein B0J14DRAFT_131520 [Halenospora varia]